ncbi:MAG: hypothetical protein WC473_05560 [Patescibacteria group bacterium]
MSIETRTGTEEELTARNRMQRMLFGQYLAEGKVSETDPETMKKIFTQVSDILDGDNPAYDSIRIAFKSGDYDATVSMLKTVVEL